MKVERRAPGPAYANLHRSGRSPRVPIYGQTIKDKGHAGITPHGLCETVPLGPPEIASRAHSLRVEALV
jgi:hypothetical protein